MKKIFGAALMTAVLLVATPLGAPSAAMAAQVLGNHVGYATDARNAIITNDAGHCWQQRLGAEVVTRCPGEHAPITVQVPVPPAPPARPRLLGGRMAPIYSPVRAPVRSRIVRANFAPNVSRWPARATKKIYAVPQALARRTQVKVRGYADYTGNAARNKTLALERAKAAKAALVRKGYRAANIKIQGIAPATTARTSPCAKLSESRRADCLARDRKVEIEIRAQAR